MRSTKQFCGEHHSGELLHGFHALIGRSQIRPASHDAVILEQDRIVVVDQPLEPRAQFPGSGCSIGSQGNFAETDDYLREYRFFEGPSGGGESCRRRRVAMANGTYIWPRTVVEKMHLHFGRGTPCPTDDVAAQVRNQQVFYSEPPFALARRCHENSVLIQSHGEVAFVRDDVALRIHPASDSAYLPAVLLLGTSCGGLASYCKLAGHQSAPCTGDD